MTERPQKPATLDGGGLSEEHPAGSEDAPSTAVLRFLGSGMSREELRKLFGFRKPIPPGVSRSRLLRMIKDENQYHARLEWRANWTSKKPTTTPERVARRAAVKCAFFTHGHLLEKEEFRILHLQMNEGKSQREIASLLEVSINVINKRMMETKEKLLALVRPPEAQEALSAQAA